MAAQTRPPDDAGAASARLQALRPSVGGWIPDQPLDATEQPESRGVPDRTAEKEGALSEHRVGATKIQQVSH